MNESFDMRAFRSWIFLLLIIIAVIEDKLSKQETALLLNNVVGFFVVLPGTHPRFGISRRER